MNDNVFICTKENPWSKEKWDGRVRHPGAIEGEQNDGWPSGDLVDYSCPYCGHIWQVELPQ